MMKPILQDVSLTEVLRSCTRLCNLKLGKKIHASIIISGLDCNLILSNTLVDMYAKCRSIESARDVFDRMCERNVVSWTALIAGYTQQGYSGEALLLLRQMVRDSVKPNQFTFSTILRACASLAGREQGKQLHAIIIPSGFESHVVVCNAVMDMYAKCGQIDDARQVFAKMSERDVISWNSLVAGYVQHSNVNEALNLFYQMQQQGTKPDEFTFASIVSACVVLVALNQGRQVHASIMKSGFGSHVVLGSSLVDLYAKCRGLEEARQVFDEMPRRNAVSWTTMITGYAQQGKVTEALSFFYQMQQEGIELDEFTLATILGVFASQASLEHGKQIHGKIIRSIYNLSITLGNALINMYMKCGRVEEARLVFDWMAERNVISWTSIISGYGNHGNGKEVVHLFEQMQLSGIKPDHVSFLTILSACSHAGLVDEGWHYFNSMIHHHCIEPKAEHYACMVDLLGRAGQLDEAVTFIREMPVEPNVAVWEALLGACRIHHNMELGKLAAEFVFKLNPDNPASYVLLSNIHAAAGRWGEVSYLRKLMTERGLKKEPGCSWIEVGKKVHAFLVGDRSHPQTEEIYAMLDGLSGKMKEVGYMPDTNFVLHDLEEEQKENVLTHHSEKLAIVFGLINTLPGMSVKVFKNLRVCGDCHTSIKFISAITGREIIVRDANRFHHFKNGICSCGDYW